MANRKNDMPLTGKPQDDVADTDALHDHERVDAMMPWINRDALEDEDRDLVDEKLSSSPAFQAKLAQESDLAAALEEIAVEEAEECEADADAAWARFKARLPDESSPVPEDTFPEAHPLPKTRATGTVRTSAWRQFRLPQTGVGWLATAQTAALAALAFVFVSGQLEPAPDEYRLLSSDDPAGQAPAGNIVVIFDPAADQAVMQALLTQADARIVDGPMAKGGYVLRIGNDNLDAGMAILRKSEAIVMVQRLDAEPVQ